VDAQDRGELRPPREGLFTSVRVIQGSSLRAGFIELQPDRVLGEEAGGSLALNSAPVASDSWTALLGETDDSPPDSLENESYSFNAPTSGLATITFCTSIKVPRGGLPAGMGADIVIIPATPRNGGSGSDLPPRPVTSIFIDDIFFGNPGPGTTPRQVIAFADLPLIEQVLGAGTFDWFVLVDFAATLSADDDMNGVPDIALETAGGTIILKATNSLDQVGADVVDFFSGNAPRVNVFESRGLIPAPRAGFPGMLPGEDATTRPWSFVIQ
jgi:hypothetical protein